MVRLFMEVDVFAFSQMMGIMCPFLELKIGNALKFGIYLSKARYEPEDNWLWCYSIQRKDKCSCICSPNSSTYVDKATNCLIYLP